MKPVEFSINDSVKTAKIIKNYEPNLDKFFLNKANPLTNTSDIISDKTHTNTLKDSLNKVNTATIVNNEYLLNKHPTQDKSTAIDILDNMEDNSSDTINLNILENLQVRSISKGINTENSSYIYNSTRNKIKDKLNTTLEKDITDSIRSRFIFRKLGDVFETVAQVMTLASTITAFAAGYWDITLISFIAGGLGSCSLALLKAASYSHKESKERSDQLNILLDKAKIKMFPSLINEGV
tara:strand:- start:1607 stop:2320 length:714 start_codon:yes stop_codon:yes gene_type:complete